MKIAKFIGRNYHTNLRVYTWIQMRYNFYFIANTQNKINRNANLYTFKHKKGISVNRFETQYADDTSLTCTLDVNDKFFFAALYTVEFYARLSDLKLLI